MEAASPAEIDCHHLGRSGSAQAFWELPMVREGGCWDLLPRLSPPLAFPFLTPPLEAFAPESEDEGCGPSLSWSLSGAEKPCESAV